MYTVPNSNWIRRTTEKDIKYLSVMLETEYEQLGIQFDVNQLYELEMFGQTMHFKKVS